MCTVEYNKDSTEIQYLSVQSKFKYAVEAATSVTLFETPFLTVRMFL